MHTKEILTPLLLETFRRVTADLPSEISERLTSSRAVRNHGTYRTLLLFNVWDSHQVDVLHRDYFNYCFGYAGSDSLPFRLGEGKRFYLHLWINTIRLYRSQQEIREVLEHDIPQACPSGFKFFKDERSVQAKMTFDFEQPLERLPDYLTTRYVALIGSLHPVLMPIIDAFSEPLSKEERRMAILGRKRHYFGPRTRPSRNQIEDYTRSVPPSWRPEILAKHNHRCVHCGQKLAVKTAHMDHIVPFSLGGQTTKDNLQPLCGPCNLRKGNRSTM